LWVGTEQGLNLYDRNKDLFQKISNKNFGDGAAINLSVRSIVDDNRGNLFVGTFGKGLYKMDIQTRKAIAIKARNIDLSIPLSIHVLKMDKDGRMYAATNHGILFFNKDDSVLEPAVFTNQEQLNSPTQTLVIDSKDNLWTGTSSDG